MKKTIAAGIAIMMTLAGTGQDAMAGEQAKGAQVIAHRGYWDTPLAVQNSRASLKNALELKVYGSETDVWLTSDGQLMANHDMTFNGVSIKDATADECRALTLANGEQMPSLIDFIEIIKASDSPTKLIIEIKDHGTDRQNQAAASAAVAAVKSAGVADKVEYISAAQAACLEIIADDPEAKVAYLTGGIAPAALKQQGYTGIDYHMNELRQNPQWVKEAHDLGMTVNVWTATSRPDINEMTRLGVDFVTTDAPLTAIEIKADTDARATR